MAVKSFTIDVGLVPARLKELGDNADDLASYAMSEVGDELLRLSEKEVPLDEGTLANTGVSQPEGKDHVVGFNTPYAARLHEHPEYNFRNGRKGKYLEDPIKHNLKAFHAIAQLAVKNRLGI